MLVLPASDWHKQWASLGGSIKQNMKSLEVKFTSEVADQLNQATEFVKTKLGPNPDLF